MPSEEGTLLTDMLVEERHVREGVHMEILVVSEDEDDVGPWFRGGRRGCMIGWRFGVEKGGPADYGCDRGDDAAEEESPKRES